MPIPESQLETWSHQGSTVQSAQTYESVKNVLANRSSPYYYRDFSIFLQGSYGNATNIYRDSDVDIVIRLNQTYYSDASALTEDAKKNYERARQEATYSYRVFKAEVLAWLVRAYETDVVPGKIAIAIKKRGSRRDADVLVCAKHRRYWKSSDGADSRYDEGICFWDQNGTQIVNYPKQHADNLTAKHKETNHWLKPVVRIYKNMRNHMIDGGYIGDGIAPSYFIEGMLWNVPADQFGMSYVDSLVKSFNWVLHADQAQLTCANGLYWLARDGSSNCWPTAKFEHFLAAVARFWEDWV